MKKKSLSMLLALLLTLSLLPVTALAAETPIDAYLFPDSDFRNYVSDKIDTSHNGKLSSAEINAVKSIDVSSKGIHKMNGVEIFTKLEELRCDNNYLRSLDVSQNTALKILSCRTNYLDSLDVSKNTALTTLICRTNYLYKLDVSQNTALSELDCSENYISTLKVSNSPKLVEAYVNGNESISGDAAQYTVGTGKLKIDTRTKVITGLEPKITAQPKDAAVKEGATATFKVTASGEKLTYQWFVKKKGASDWSKLSGKTSPTLKVTAARAADGSKYRCVVSRGRVSTTSAAATLTVNSKPKITTQPKNLTVRAGKTATFKVKADGSNLKYQWYSQKPGTSKWVKMSGKTKATLSFNAKKSMNGYKYYCLVKNTIGDAKSKTVKLTVK